MNSARTSFQLCVLALALVALGACSTPAPPAPQPTRPDRDLVGEIRAAGSATGSAIEVQPLRDPAVDGFVKQAGELEAAGKYNDAIGALDRALKVAPDAPELLQQKAELFIALRQYDHAETLARKSFELGPKLGSLCARNWQTVVEVRRMANDSVSVESAKAQLASCRIAPRVRM
ncbi:tetratricopeptide repeat protein [Tahibacter amnicola]|uniref:Tetratricopeptide repeat protein n=1 Tax=Tahibacter amnicola TaxID=2976241 RepID=A0ABY6BEI8_9GAMM|nr:tetratricopeptide repeat protein [Tahibacter amnicola]UXI67520.1 tetratricopeptide repeat protein [Tahibacter amnicola]